MLGLSEVIWVLQENKKVKVNKVIKNFFMFQLYEYILLMRTC